MLEDDVISNLRSPPLCLGVTVPRIELEIQRVFLPSVYDNLIFQNLRLYDLDLNLRGNFLLVILEWI